MQLKALAGAASLAVITPHRRGAAHLQFWALAEGCLSNQFRHAALTQPNVAGMERQLRYKEALVVE